jgi:hypothetical protein
VVERQAGRESEMMKGRRGHSTTLTASVPGVTPRKSTAGVKEATRAAYLGDGTGCVCVGGVMEERWSGRV